MATGTRTNITIETVEVGVLFEDNNIEYFALKPGETVVDILWERGDKRDYIMITTGLKSVTF